MKWDRIVAAFTIAGLAAWVGWSYSTGGIIHALFDGDMGSAEKLAAIRGFFQSWGILGPVIYVGIVIVEVVVAPLPGTILYMPGGVIFGGFWGGTLTLVGNTIGAGIACVLMRSLVGRQLTRNFFASGSLARAKALVERHGLASIALLRVNPMTSSDLISYAAGLTPIPALTVMTGTAIGLAPLCYIQSYLAMGLFTAFPWLLWPLIAGCALYLVLAFVAIRRLRVERMAGAKA